MTTNMKLSLTPKADHDLEFAQAFLAQSISCLQQAKECIYNAMTDAQKAGNEVDSRKLFSHHEAIATRLRDLEADQLRIAERRGINTNPDCICGMSSRCEVKGHR